MMGIKVFEAYYKGQRAVTLESGKLKVQFLPRLGAKMASMVSKETSREFLAQRPGSEYKALRYDGCYVDSECSGFDDMFPTIDPCYYEDYPWAGVRAPDHGEVCSLEWDYRIDGESLYMGTYGVRFPYRLEKRVRFEKEDLLDISYTATNLSSFDMDFLWAAHPMINAEEDGELLLPFEKEKDVICVFSQDARLGSYGDILTWPVTRTSLGDCRLNITKKRDAAGNNYKFYFNGPMPEGWCSYRYKSDNEKLTMYFPVDTVPYFSIWVNEGSFHGFHTIAPEPCTGAFDRIDLAKKHGMNSVLPAKGQYTWYLKFGVIQDKKL